MGDELFSPRVLEAKIKAERALIPTLEELHRQQLLEIGMAISNLIDAVKSTAKGMPMTGFSWEIERDTRLALASEHLEKLEKLAGFSS